MPPPYGSASLPSSPGTIKRDSSCANGSEKSSKDSAESHPLSPRPSKRSLSFSSPPSPNAASRRKTSLNLPPHHGPFVSKLYQMLHDPASHHLISFTPSGESFVIHNPTDFSRALLPAYFKHNNFSSFVRQLNMYNFHKSNKAPRGSRVPPDEQEWEFAHPHFKRSRLDLLDRVRRRIPEGEVSTSSYSKNSPSQSVPTSSTFQPAANPTTPTFPVSAPQPSATALTASTANTTSTAPTPSTSFHHNFDLLHRQNASIINEMNHLRHAHSSLYQTCLEISDSHNHLLQAYQNFYKWLIHAGITPPDHVAPTVQAPAPSTMEAVEARPRGHLHDHPDPPNAQRISWKQAQPTPINVPYHPSPARSDEPVSSTSNVFPGNVPNVSSTPQSSKMSVPQYSHMHAGGQPDVMHYPNSAIHPDLPPHHQSQYPSTPHPQTPQQQKFQQQNNSQHNALQQAYPQAINQTPSQPQYPHLDLHAQQTPQHIQPGSQENSQKEVFTDQSRPRILHEYASFPQRYSSNADGQSVQWQDPPSATFSNSSVFAQEQSNLLNAASGMRGYSDPTSSQTATSFGEVIQVHSQSPLPTLSVNQVPRSEDGAVTEELPSVSPKERFQAFKFPKDMSNTVQVPDTSSDLIGLGIGEKNLTSELSPNKRDNTADLMEDVQNKGYLLKTEDVEQMPTPGAFKQDFQGHSEQVLYQQSLALPPQLTQATVEKESR